MKKYRGFLFMLIGVAILTWTATAWAQVQSTTGTIQGVVVDQSGAVLPGVDVSIKHVATGIVRSLVTDQLGRFSAPLLPVGNYEIGAQLSGFSSVTESDKLLTLGQVMELRITMHVAGVSTEVAIAAEVPMIEVTKADVSTLVNNRSVESLPLNGRRFLDLAFLTPGVSLDPERNQISFAGQRGINSNINVDGADFNQPFFGGQKGGERTNDAYVVSQEAIQEFQVLRSGFNAEFGRSTGGVVNVITKSGGNDFHGSAFYYLRHRELAETNAFGDIVAPIRHQFGASLGGRIKRDKTFFFTAYDGQQQNQPTTIRFNTPSGSPTTTDLPASILSRQGVLTSTNDVDTYIAKIDHQLTNNNRLTGRYNFSRNIALNGTFAGGVQTGTPDNNGTERDRTHTGVVNLNSIVTPTLLNEFRFQYSREDRPRVNNLESDDFKNVAGPQTQISGCCFLGGVSFLPVPEYDDKFQFTDNMNFMVGQHNLKWGMDYSRSHVKQIFRGNWRGVYVFNNIQNFLNVYNKVPGMAPDQFRIFFGDGRFEVPVHEAGAFFQDAFKIGNKLSITAGLRWNGVVYPQPTTPNGFVPKTATIPNDKQQWQPRLGFSYDVTGSGWTVFRASGGIFTSGTPMLLLNQAFNANGSSLVGSAFTLNSTQILQAQSVHPEFVWPFVPNTDLATNASYFTAAGIQGLKPDASFFASDFKNPRSYNLTAGLDQMITEDFVASIEYVHANTVNLERIRDVNLFPGVVSLDNSSPQVLRPRYNTSVRPDPNFNVMRQQESSARSRYDAFTLSGSHRYEYRLQFQASYTLAYNRDDDSNERNFAGVTYEDAFNLAPEFRWSRNDIRHKFVGSGTADLPLNFQTSLILTYRSGLPFSAFTGVDSNGDSQTNDKPIINGIPLLRNSFRQPNFFNIDLRASRSFRLGENQRIEFLADLFNLLNRRNLTYGSSTNESTTTALGSRWGTGQTPLPTFRTLYNADGTPNRNTAFAGTPFQAQLALKYIF
jgi:hypothetical protein